MEQYKPFCVEYKQHQNKIMSDAAELRITVHSDSDFSKIENFLNLFPNQRIIIYLDEKLEAYMNEKKLEDIYKAIGDNTNYTFQIITQSREDRKLAENILQGRPHYYDIAITSWDQFYEFYQYDVTDIIISEILCFELKKVRDLANLKGLKLRAYPDICQASGDVPVYLQFFIRPEDIEVYHQYIDIFDFWKKDKELALFSIYAYNQTWSGSLEYLITDFHKAEQDMEIDSNKLFNFGSFRANCGKRCLQTYDGIGRCNACMTNFSIATTMKDLNYCFKKISD